MPEFTRTRPQVVGFPIAISVIRELERELEALMARFDRAENSIRDANYESRGYQTTYGPDDDAIPIQDQEVSNQPDVVEATDPFGQMSQLLVEVRGLRELSDAASQSTQLTLQRAIELSRASDEAHRSSRELIESTEAFLAEVRRNRLPVSPSKDEGSVEPLDDSSSINKNWWNTWRYHTLGIFGGGMASLALAFCCFRLGTSKDLPQQ